MSAATRWELDAGSSSCSLLGAFVRAADALDAPVGATWGVAMPDPFDYGSGVALFEGVGKFAALRGVDVGSALRGGIAARPAGLAFVNDADAFVLGEWSAGAADGAGRCVGITLGTGVGSGWLVDGRVVDPGDPPGGRLHRVTVGGRPLEDTISRRALRRSWTQAGGDPALDVREIAARARGGDASARRVLDQAFTVLGRVVGSCVAGFRADVLVIGGSMARSWDVVEPAFRAGALGSGLPEIRVAQRGDDAALVGAAVHAARG